MDASKTLDQRGGKQRRFWGFWALNATQFQGAFNDNLFKFLIIYFLVGLSTNSLTGAADEATTGRITSIATMLFALPFIVFPGPFGALSDRYSKRRVTIWTRYIEVVIMSIGVAGFYFKMPALLWTMLFMTATHSAFFSPSKYGILPEILPPSRLSWGNGVIAMATMLAIISGTGVAGRVYESLAGRTYLAGVGMATLSVIGICCSYGITRVPAANPSKRIPLNPWSDMGRHLKFFWSNRTLLMILVGYTYFWFAGAFLQQTVITYGKITLGLGEGSIGYMQACLAMGIGVGSLAAGYLSRGKIELGLVPVGLMGIVVSSLALVFPGVGYSSSLWLLAGIGFCAGLFNVPLAAAIQHRSPADAKGGVIAMINVMTFAGTFVAGGLFWFLSSQGVTARGMFLVTALLSLVLCIYLCMMLPFFVVRFITWFFSSTFYRVKVVGVENIPTQGGAMLLGNHMAFIDPGVVLSAVDRPLRFLGYRAYVGLWYLKPFMKMGEVIPISAQDGPEALIQSLRTAGEAIKNGDLVCVFPEGGISRIGQLLVFQKGYRRIMKDVDAPIIPFHIDNNWGSVFSFSEGRFFWKWPKRFPLRVTISFGKPLPADASPYRVRCAIQELASAAYPLRTPRPDLLHRVFIRRARRHPLLMGVADARTGALSYFKTLVGSIILARKLHKALDGHPRVGVLVPPSVGGALTNIALQIMGRTAVNLNYTASAQTIAASAAKCGLTHCITARAFLERMPMDVPGKPIYLEDIMASVVPKDRIVGLLLAVFCPIRLLERLVGLPGKRSMDDAATIVFSSGSEGEPKGIVLTHAGIMHNVVMLAQVFQHKPGDAMMGILPFFHSFGFTGTIWVSLLNDLGAVFHPSPLEAKAIGGLIRKYKAVFFIATPTFLQSFTRRCDPGDFASLKYLVCGAEKLTPRVRDAFIEKFGVEPLEGYGTTECSPVVSLNLPDLKVGAVSQRGNKRDTIGRPLPGVSVRVVDPDTGEVLLENCPGMLQIKGPNLMKGYLGMPEKTAAVLHNGWYSSGDIASVDEEGFITITDRLARFSKIGGEMVSHTKVEEMLHELLGLAEQSLAVASVPDPNRGERLVVLHTLSQEQLDELFSKLDRCGLPNLWRPKPNAFHRIDQIPVLGTGKMDLKGVKTLASQLDKN